MGQPEIILLHPLNRSGVADVCGFITHAVYVQALNKWSGSFTRADEHMLQLFGVHLGNTLTKSRYYEEAKWVISQQ